MNPDAPPSTESDQNLRPHSLPGVYLRGLCMGAADIVPGVSGGTIAFITGIYFRLLSAISAFPGAFVGELLRGRVASFWQAIDGSFLIALLAGVVTSIALLAGVISQALRDYPILLWSFFFGLIVAAVWHVGREIHRLSPVLLAPLVGGCAFAWWVTTLSPAQTEPTALVLFGSGALAICAMILPGISGSFILLVLGMYGPVLSAINNVELGSLGLFVAGCALGLLSIARLLNWAIRRFHDPMLALLTGFMIGALNKVWPWREVLSWRTDSSGERVPVQEVSVSPWQYASATGDSPEILLAAVAGIAGLALVLSVDFLGRRMAGNVTSDQ